MPDTEFDIRPETGYPAKSPADNKYSTGYRISDVSLYPVGYIISIAGTNINDNIFLIQEISYNY